MDGPLRYEWSCGGDDRCGSAGYERVDAVGLMSEVVRPGVGQR